MGTIGKLASAMWVIGSPLPGWILNMAMGIESSPRIRSNPVPFVGNSVAWESVTVRSLSGKATDLPSWPSSAQSKTRVFPDRSG